MLLLHFLSIKCRLSFAFACLISTFAFAAITVGDDASPQQVSALLKQLDAKSRQQRLAAEAELLKLGPAILDSLPPQDLLPNVSVREAVRRLRTQLERTAAEQSIRASHVTLAGERTLRELIAAISEQTGNNVVCAATDRQPTEPDLFEQKLTVDWENEPFWDAIIQIEAADFRAKFLPDEQSLTLSLAASNSRAIARQTQQQAFRLEALPVEQRQIDGTDNVLIRVPLRILCEPRLRPLFLRCSMSDWSLTAGTERLSPFSPGSRVEIPLGDGGREARLELSFLASSAASVSRNLALRGRLTLLTAGLEREITFPMLAEAEGLTRRRGGVTVTVNKAQLSRSNSGNHSARVSTQIGYDSEAKAFESHQTWIFHNRVFLRDPKGNEYPANDGFSTLFQGDGSVGVEYRFSQLPSSPAKWQFTYVAPTLLIDVPLDVQIDGIPVAGDSKQR
jgi:hypothetical protein